jgi:hypothetical protein
MEIVSPSQPRPAVIHSTSISANGGVSRWGGMLVIRVTPVVNGGGGDVRLSANGFAGSGCCELQWAKSYQVAST